MREIEIQIGDRCLSDSEDTQDGNVLGIDGNILQLQYDVCSG